MYRKFHVEDQTSLASVSVMKRLIDLLDSKVPSLMEKVFAISPVFIGTNCNKPSVKAIRNSRKRVNLRDHKYKVMLKKWNKLYRRNQIITFLTHRFTQHALSYLYAHVTSAQNSNINPSFLNVHPLLFLMQLIGQ